MACCRVCVYGFGALCVEMVVRVDGNMRRNERESKVRESSGSIAGNIEMTGEKLRLDGIFDEGDSGPFGIIEWEGQGVVKGMAFLQDTGTIATLIIKHVQAT